MKKAFKIIIGFVTFIALILVVVFYLTSGLSEAGTGFFEALKNDNMEEAYTYLSQNFKTSTSEEELEHFLKQYGLKDIVDVSWGGRSFNNNLGSIEGTVTTALNGTVPVTLNFIEEGSVWKILSINTAAAGVQTTSNKPLLPSKLEQKILIRETIHIFGQSVNEHSMKKLHNHLAKLWQDKIDVQKLDEIFVGFLMPILIFNM